MRPAKKVKMQDIADALGISIASVSYVLSGRKNVSGDLREKILEEAKRQGYVYTARKENRPKYRIRIEMASDEEKYWLPYLKKAMSQHAMEPAETLQEADGVFCCNKNPELLHTAAMRKNLPVVFVGNPEPDLRVDSVATDAFSGIQQGFFSLLQRGMSDISFVEGSRNQKDRIDRRYGFVCACSRFLGTPEEEEREVYPDAGAFFACRGDHLPDAVICGDLISADWIEKERRKRKKELLVIPCAPWSKEIGRRFAAVLVPDEDSIAAEAVRVMEERLQKRKPSGIHSVGEKLIFCRENHLGA